MAKPPERNKGEATQPESFEELGRGSRVVTTIARLFSPPENKKGKELIDACGKGNLEAVTSLLQSGVKPDHRTAHWTPLIAASEMGHFDIVQALLAAKSQVNLTCKETKTALHAASYRGHLDIVRILLEKGAVVNMVDQEGQTALHRASFAGNLDIVNLLVESGADVNKQGKDGSTPLHQSSGQGHVAIVQLLLDYKAKASLRLKKWERTALHSASMSGHTEVVEMLLHTDLYINDQDQYGMTPLIFAAIGGHTDTVRFLVQAEADLDTQNKNGMTALMFAVKKDKFDVAKVLVGSGADVNIQEHKENGWSAIFFAVEKGSLSMVMLLFEAGADLEISDKHNNTPLNVAKQHSSEVYKKLLEAKSVGCQKTKTVEVDSSSVELKEKKKVSCFKYSDDHPGMCFFLNPWRQTVSVDGANICWEEIGIEFDIPCGAVPEGKLLELSVWPSIAGPFVLPEGYDLASPVYLISPAFDFACSITLRMYHYCGLETEQQCDNMVFISSPSTPNIVQAYPQYQFKVLSKGSFHHSEAYGCVSLKHFCNAATAVKRKRTSSESPEENGPSAKKTRGDAISNRYSLRMYDAKDEYLAVFSACLNQRTYFEVMKELLKDYFPSSKFRPIIIHDPAQMSSSTLELQWPRDKGWEVFSDRTPCEISKDTLDFPDSVPHGEYPPYIELQIKPASSAGGHQCSSHLVFDVLGLSKKYQFTLDLETKNTGSLGTHFSAQPHMHGYSQSTHQQYPQYHMFPGRASLSPPYSPPYLGQSCIHSPPYGLYMPSHRPVQHPSRSGLPIPSPPYTGDPLVPLSNLSVEDNGSQKVPLFRADAKPDIRLLNRFPCLSRPSGYIDILTQAASHYQTVGNILLNSPDGARVRVIELRHNRDPYPIIYDIFQIWLSSDETASWRKLVLCFRDAADELSTVAKDIENTLVH